MKKPPAKTVNKQDTRFKPGQSGNPKGRKYGSRNKVTIAAQALLEGEAEVLARKCIEQALRGNMTALRICMDRLVPVMKERPVSIDLPKVENTEDVPIITATILQAVADGKLDPGQAVNLAKVVQVHQNSIELIEVEERLKKLEDVKK